MRLKKFRVLQMTRRWHILLYTVELKRRWIKQHIKPSRGSQSLDSLHQNVTLWLWRKDSMPGNQNNFPVRGWMLTKATSLPISRLGRASKQPAPAPVNSNLSIPCLLHIEPRNFFPTACGLMGSSASCPGGKKAKLGNKIPWTFSTKDYQTPALKFYLIITGNNDSVDPSQSLRPQRERTQLFLISTCTINKANALSEAVLKPLLWVRGSEREAFSPSI